MPVGNKVRAYNSTVYYNMELNMCDLEFKR